MRKPFILTVLMLLSVASFAQKSPEQLGGVYYAYPKAAPSLEGDMTAIDPAVALPEGCGEPFYISHYGRHGSRWLTSDERYKWVMAHFDDKRNLTPLGKSLRKRLAKVWQNARGHGGRLTPLGARQQRGIAHRMFVAFPQLFADDARLSAHASTVSRCQSSMQHFVDQLKTESPSIHIEPVANEADMAWMAYNSAEQKQLEQRIRIPLTVSPQRLMRSLFKDASKVENPTKLLTELHTIASDMQDVELNVSLYDIFTREELVAVYRQNNERMTICNGDTPQNEGIPARSAHSLWQHIESDADAMIASGERGADLRFGHDTNLYRLLTLMGIDTRGWGMDEILPMAANLQMVFCRNAQHEVTVCLLLNEESVGCYAWNELKARVNGRIHRLEHLRQLSALNTRVGTAQANTLSAGRFGKGSEEHGQTLPAVLWPNGQNCWTPQTQDTERKCIAPYYYRDSLFQGFRNSHWIVGGCTQDYGSFTVAALGGALRTSPEKRATPFCHDEEVAHPHSYAVTLPKEHLRAELTAASHAAMLRLTPLRPSSLHPQPSTLTHLVIQPNSDEGQGYVFVDTCRQMVYGYNPVHRIYQGWGQPAGFSGHFVLRYQLADSTRATTEKPLLVDFGTFRGDSIFPRITEMPGSLPRPVNVDKGAPVALPMGAYLSFLCPEGQSLTFTMASSFTSREGAMLNLKAETRDGRMSFDEMQQRLVDAWVDRLHTIDVCDPDTERVNQFYGALYRASFLPREVSDVDGALPAFAASDSVSHSSQPRFTDFSAWDTYRALHPLYNILLPRLSGIMMQSLVDMYSSGGWLPIFPCWNSYTAAMIGDHCAAMLADAYVKGVGGFDAQTAYMAMRKNAFETPDDVADYRNGMGRRALKSYLKHGFIPLEDKVLDAFHVEEQTSRTLEYAFDDFAVAQMAKALDRFDDYRILMGRSGNWRNVVNPATGWADGRHASGKWLGNTDLVHRQNYITEGATCHYSWYVPHDIPALIERMGGAQRFEQKLDSMFGPSIGLPKGETLYWHGNEPCHQIPFLYNYTAQPWKTQRAVRHILSTEYNDSPGGLSGNDDAGQMSAWYIFAALGFYPVCPATKAYELASPTFQHVTLNLENGRKFNIEAPDASTENIYVRSVTIDGRPLPPPVGNASTLSISHDDILRGATLHFDMAPQP